MSARALAVRAAAAFAASLGLYLATLTPAVPLVDSGELIAAAQSLGVAHPPGFPLYVLLAHLATLVPVGSIAVRVNAASALFAALAVAAMVLAAAASLGSAPRRRDERGKAAPPVRESPAANTALAAALLFAFSRTLWSYATVAEVYTLNALAIVAIIALALWWRRRRLERAADADDRPLHLAALIFGLGLGCHVVTVGLLLPALAWLVLRTEGARFFLGRRILVAAAFATLGVGVYVYLPLAAARSPLMNWGDPDTLERLMRHVTGRQYWVSFGASGEQLVSELAGGATYLLREWGWPWVSLGLPLSILGWSRAWARDRTLAIFLVLIVAADTAYSVSYQIAEDKDAYFLPAFIAFAIAAAHGALALLSDPPRWMRRVPRPVLAALVFLAPAIALATNLPYNDRHRDRIAQTLAEDVLAPVAQGGLVLTGEWQVYAPLFYLHELERMRPDVVVVDVRLLRRSWYFDHLRRAYPDFMEPVRLEVDAFLEDLLAWERDAAGFERDAARLRRIDARFFGMILAMIRSHRSRAPVYVTRDVALDDRTEDAKLSRALLQTYVLVPRGLVFALGSDPGFHDPGPDRLRERMLRQARPRFEANDVVIVKVLPMYAGMLAARGEYLAAHGRYGEAIDPLERALAIQPGFERATRALDLSRQALGAGGSP